MNHPRVANHPAGRHDLPRHRRHQVLERYHDGLQPPGHFFVGGFETAGAVPFGIQFGKQPVALGGEEADLILQRRDRNAFVGFREDLPQEALELIDRRVKPLGRLLQSVGLAHCAPPPSSGAALVFASRGIKLLDARINVNVVTAHAMFNNRKPPLLVPATGD
jgi:hypothetical protein